MIFVDLFIKRAIRLINSNCLCLGYIVQRWLDLIDSKLYNLAFFKMLGHNYSQLRPQSRLFSHVCVLKCRFMNYGFYSHPYQELKRNRLATSRWWTVLTQQSYQCLHLRVDTLPHILDFHLGSSEPSVVSYASFLINFFQML